MSSPSQHRQTSISLDHPRALFVAEADVGGPAPASRHLLKLLPGSLRNNPPTISSPDGSRRLEHEEDFFLRHEVPYGTERVQVVVQGDIRYGRPRVHDLDYILGIFRLADEGGVRSDGTIDGPSFRAMLRAAGRGSDMSGERIDAARAALLRLGGTMLQASIDFTDLGEPTGGLMRALPSPGTAPDATTRKAVQKARPIRTNVMSNYTVLEYEIQQTDMAGRLTDSIFHLRINPTWLAHGAADNVAWMNVDLIQSLASPLAKAFALAAHVRIAERQWRPGEEWVLDFTEILEILRAPAERQRGRQQRGVIAALEVLRDRGVLHFRTEPSPVRRGEVRFRMLPGELLQDLACHVGNAGTDSVGHRVLMRHLRRLGVGATQARVLVDRDAPKVLEVVRRAYYLMDRYQGKESPNGDFVRNWPGWILNAVNHEYVFGEPEYITWQLGVSTGEITPPVLLDVYGRPPLPLPATSVSRQMEREAPLPLPPAPASAPPTVSTDTWGRLLLAYDGTGVRSARIAAHVLAASTWLAREEGGVLEVVPDEAFHDAEGKLERERAQLERVGAELLGYPIGIKILRPAPRPRFADGTEPIRRL